MHHTRLNAPITYFLLSFFFVFFSSSTAYNITEVLNKYPDFSIFNDYLTRTKVSNQINEHRIMTVLVVKNAAMSSLVGKSIDVINKVMRIHVFLDYYTLNKFKSLPTSQPAQLTTLFESPDQHRYLNVTNGATVSIVSAAGSEKVEVVRDISPDDIYKTSIVEVSNVILPSTLSTSPRSPSPSSPSPTVASSPSPTVASSPSSSTFNITKFLNNYPNFNQFNTYLTETQVCDQINARSTVTVLVVNNAAMSSLVGKSTEIKKKVLSLHVVMDYYTSQSFHNLPSSQTTQLTTLLQSSFQSIGFQGLLNATHGDTVSILSAVGSDKVDVVKDIFAENSKISVVQISNLIVPSDSTSSPSTLSPSVPSPSPSSSSSAFNITQILNKYPEFSIFNDYLTRTQVSNQINERRTLTILVANNEAMSSLVGQPMDVIRKVLSLQVVLDYYNVQKLHNLPVSKSTRIITLLEAADKPSGQQGFVNITNGDTISIVSGAGSDQALVIRDVVADELFTISVVQINKVIVPSGLTSPPSSPSLSPSPSILSSPSSSTFNITKILNNYPEFSQFNTYLTDTQVCDQINARTTVTVLVVNNAAMSSLVGKSTEIKKRVLSLHVITDYYTSQSFHNFPTLKTTQLTTLLQDSFQSNGFQGLLNATSGDAVSIVSAAGSDKVEIVKDIFTENLKISVVQINNLIVPSDSTSPSSSPSPSESSPSVPSSSAPSSSAAFDITKILSSNSDFNLFNNYLTQTQVANQINEHKTMTVFVVNNGAMTSLVDKPMEIKKKVLSLHVIMDYYTVQKFHNLPVSQPTRINTLLQVTDEPSGQQGLVNITNGDTISIVSAAGSDQAVVVRDVADKNNTISVVQISNLILPSGLIAPTSSPSPSTSSNPSKLRAAAPVQAPSSSIASAPNLGGAPLSNAPNMGSAPLPNAPNMGSAPMTKAPNLASTPWPNAPLTNAPNMASAPWPNAPNMGSAPLSNTPTMGIAPLSNAPISDPPMSVALSPESPLSNAFAAGPQSSGTPARFSINCASVLTIILVSTLPLISVIQI
ncbi:FASCICLIN-like arabinogalactan protein 14 precursor [Prunus dulcis]|uniref:FASCICLIN-like arabinogalactan protein 14 n=1 Tax=Prunus dulcis TaxID=3755 RepID=A0A4Y1R551_PRUDU|nr:FASCICLIN-like arabinogalactan protein 14 precursor [Prunus dulcis]